MKYKPIAAFLSNELNMVRTAAYYLEIIPRRINKACWTSSARWNCILPT